MSLCPTYATVGSSVWQGYHANFGSKISDLSLNKQCQYGTLVSLKNSQDDLECMLIRACKIAFPQLSYRECLKNCEIPTLQQRRIEQCKKIFHKPQFPCDKFMDKLHRIILVAKDNVKNTRNSTKYLLHFCHTSRYRTSFLLYVLFNCQN